MTGCRRKRSFKDGLTEQLNSFDEGRLLTVSGHSTDSIKPKGEGTADCPEWLRTREELRESEFVNHTVDLLLGDPGHLLQR